MEQQGPYRKEALKRLSTPEQLDSLLTITSPRSWIALIGAALVLASLLVWGYWGHVATRVTGAGILLRPGGIVRVVSGVPGQVAEVLVSREDQVDLDQLVARVLTLEGIEVPIRSRHPGRVLETLVREGDQVGTGTPLFIVEAGRTDDPEPLEAVLYVPVDLGQRIEPGMPVTLTPAIAGQGEYGMLEGRVISVAGFPASLEGAVSILGNQELAYALVGRTISREIRVALLPDQDAPSGYRWTIGRGPDIALQGGTICQGSIVIQRERPLALLFPFLRR